MPSHTPTERRKKVQRVAKRLTRKSGGQIGSGKIKRIARKTVRARMNRKG